MRRTQVHGTLTQGERTTCACVKSSARSTTGAGKSPGQRAERCGTGLP